MLFNRRSVKKVNGEVVRSRKSRPLHYASHFDSLIYAYYAEILNKRYESLLKEDPQMDSAVIAYISIPRDDTTKRGKSNIQFAKEVFDEIENRVNEKEEIVALTMDLESFFSSLNHSLLYRLWAFILGEDKLQKDHYNVFKACTNFRYVLYDDLKRDRKGFDEAKLANIRKKYGIKCYFSSNQDFRNAIQSGNLPVYQNPFFAKNETSGKKERIGIPQGLPLSAILANIYLYEFDKTILDNLVNSHDVFYRRYSDDILILCPRDKANDVNTYLTNLVKRFHLNISHEKTEWFLFKKVMYNKSGDSRISSIKLYDEKCVIDCPSTYLGFEFRGFNTTIKSANLSKYYRRLIYTIKSRARRAKKNTDPCIPKAIFINQIKTALQFAFEGSKNEGEQICSVTL